MEKVNGRPLQCPVDESVKKSLKVVEEKLRNKNFVHGDLRPQNILLLTDGSIRDCGLWYGPGANAIV